MATDRNPIATSIRIRTVSGVDNTASATFQRHRWKADAPEPLRPPHGHQTQTSNDDTTTRTMTTTTTTLTTTRYSPMLPASTQRCQYEPRHIVSLKSHCDAYHRDHYNQHNHHHHHHHHHNVADQHNRTSPPPPMLPTSYPSTNPSSGAQLQPLRCHNSQTNLYAIPSNMHNRSYPAARAHCWRCSSRFVGNSDSSCAPALATVGLLWTCAAGAMRTFYTCCSADGKQVGGDVMRCMRTLLPLLLVLNMLPMLYAGML